MGNGVIFAVNLTLLLHLPGMEPGAKPELSNFKFTSSTDERWREGCSPMADAPDMRC